MLYDPKWHNPTFQSVSLREFIAWLETKNPTATYDYGDPFKCAAAQFLESKGAAKIEVQFWGKDSASGQWLRGILNPYCGDITFGGALERARAVLAEKRGEG